MRASARRSLGWAVGALVLLALAVVGILVLAPNDGPPPASSSAPPSTAARKPSPSSSTASQDSPSPAPGRTIPGPTVPGSTVGTPAPGATTTVSARSPVPEVRIGYVGQLASL